MGKLGVGIGEDFPVEEPKPAQQGTPGQDGPDGKPGERDEHEPDSCPGAEEWRARHADWHRRWRTLAGSHGHWRGPQFWRALIIIGGIALLIAIISHFFYFILGAAVLAVLYFTHRDHHDALWDLHPHAPSSTGDAR